MRKLKLILILLSLGLAGNIHAQIYPVDIEMIGDIGASTVYFNDFGHLDATASRINFRLTLNDPDQNIQREVVFRVTVKVNGVPILKSIDGLTDPMNMIILSSGMPRLINGSQLNFYFQNENLQPLLNDFNSMYPNWTNGGILGENQYQICVEVIDAIRMVVISGEACVEGYLSQVSPPILFSPFNEQELSLGQSASLMFIWQLPRNPRPANTFISYNFELRELADGFENAQEYFENNTLIYQQENIIGNSLIYRIDLPPLVPEKKYVWRVQAVASDGMSPIAGFFENNGYSEIWSFTLPDGPEQQKDFCSARSPLLPENLVPISALAPDDIIYIGDFELMITKLENSSGGALSGSGIILIPFLDIEMEADFQNLQVNTKREVFSGRVNVVRNDTWMSKISTGANRALSFNNVGVITKEDVAHVTALARDIQKDGANRLPISLKPLLFEIRNVTMPYDLMISEMSFTPQEATFNAVMMVPNGSDGFAEFGRSAIRIDDSGFDISDLKLFLSSHATMPVFENDYVNIVAHPGETDPERGSFIYFDCTGFQGYNLQGNYRFDKEMLVRASNLSVPASASFYINSKTWGNTIADVTMYDFAIPGMDGWRFEAQEGKFDFSKDENIQGVQLPSNYIISNAEWNGFYIKDLKVKLPDELRFSNNEALEMVTHDMIIDQEGVSFTGKGYNLLALTSGSAAGWGLSFEELQLTIASNEFKDAAIKGKVIAVPISDTINYSGRIYREENADDYVIDMFPQEDIHIPFLNASIEPDEESVISIRQEPPYCVAEWRPYANINGPLIIMMPESAFKEFGGSEISQKMNQIKDSLNADGDFLFDLTGVELKGFKINHPKLPEGKYFGIDKVSVPTGAISLADVPMSLEDVDLLEEEFELNGTKPGLGLGFHISLDSFGINPVFWALNAGMKEAGPYSLAKIEIEIPKVPKKAFACDCESSVTQSSDHDYCQPALPYRESAVLQIGSTIQVGHFDMKVTAVNGNSGTGKIAIPYLGDELAVDFADVQIDDNGMVTQGTVQSAFGSAFGDIRAEALQNSKGEFKMQSITDKKVFLQNLNDQQKNRNEAFSCPVSIGQEVHQLLPVEHEGNFEFIVMGVNFEANVAKANCMAMFTTPDGQVLKFGLAGLDMRPNGFNLDGLNLYLTEESTITAYDGKPVRLLVSQPGNPESGSYVSFDCDGFNAFHLKGIYTFDQSIIVNADNGISAVDAFLDINTTSWDDFDAVVKMSPFAIPGLEGWQFEVLEAGADFSDYRNLLNMQFPPDYISVNPGWKGFFLSKLRVTMPDELRFGSNTTLSFESDNMLIDQYGLSGVLKGNSVLSLDVKKNKSWTMSVDGIQMLLQRNRFMEATIEGQVVNPLFDGVIRYNGRVYMEPVTKTHPDGFYAVDLVPTGIVFANNYRVDISASEDLLVSLRKRPKLDDSGHQVLVNNEKVFAYRPFLNAEALVLINLSKELYRPTLLKSTIGGTFYLLNAFGITERASKSDGNKQRLRIHMPDQMNGAVDGVGPYIQLKQIYPPDNK